MNCPKKIRLTVLTILSLLVISSPLVAQRQEMKETPRRGQNEGEGQFDRLVIWGATIIDGTGGPPNGPMNIVIEGNKISEIKRADLEKRPEDADRVIDARHKYVTPGFINVHSHLGGKKIDYNASYPYKLYLAHGVTTLRGVPFGETDWSLEQKELSKENEIVAPRLIVCDSGGARDIRTPEAMVQYVHDQYDKGVECFGEIGSLDPPILKAMMKTADSLGMPTMDHLDQMGVGRMTAEDAIKSGLDEVTHFYGIMESLLDEHSIQKWPLNYNYSNEYDRFSRVARLADESAERGSKEWNDLIDLSLEHETFYSPTMSIYSAGRNVMEARNADWHFDYLLPSLADYYKPNPEAHGSYFYNWTSADEASWQRFFNKWMDFIYDYNKEGGRITVGDDAAFIYQNYGFGYIKELKLLQEAGLTPFEVLRSATLYGGETIFQPHKSTGQPIKYGIIREGKLADLLVFTQNPLKDFNMLYATGALRLNKQTGETSYVRDLQYTIKDGIIYDVGNLLKDVRQMVKEAEAQAGEVDISPPSPSEVKLAPVDTVSQGTMPTQ